MNSLVKLTVLPSEGTKLCWFCESLPILFLASFRRSSPLTARLVTKKTPPCTVASVCLEGAEEAKYPLTRLYGGYWFSEPGKLKLYIFACPRMFKSPAY